MATIIAETKQNYIKYGACLLIGDYASADYWFERLSNEEKELVANQPISFFKQM